MNYAGSDKKMKSKMILVMVLGAVFLILGVASATLALDTDLENESSDDPGVDCETKEIFNERKLDMRMAQETGDLDTDGTANCEDPDDDDDGINDTLDEYPHDHDNDGVPDPRDEDDDNDGIPDEEDDEYVGNCSRPEGKFGHGLRKIHIRHQNRPQNRTLLKDRGYCF
jgi:hypothetical protein